MAAYMVNQVLKSPLPDSAHSRALPDFAVIGAMRAGTTFLHDLLARQKAICLPEMKETDYFIAEKNLDRGSDWYQARFGAAERITGDISPNYSKRDVFDGVAERLHTANPEARLIYIVRDPVARALSHYRHSLIMGQDMPAPEQFLASEKGAHILATSRYAWQLAPWLERFSVDQFLIVDFDELTCQTEQVLHLVCQFIGVDQASAAQLSTAANRTEDISALPDWFRRLRETGVGDRLRAHLPRAVTQTAKKFLARGGSAPDMPGFSDEIRAAIADALKEDIATFRTLTGKSFANWQI